VTMPDLEILESLTRDYAAFQARKSGLATALGGFMALLMTLQVISHQVRTFSESLWRLQAALVFLMPVLWLPLKEWLFRYLYRDLGPVKALPDLTLERRKWQWLFLVAMVLMSFQTMALLGFVSGYIGVLRYPETIKNLPSQLPSIWMAWLWVAAMPWLYLLAAPWWIRGVEEAQAYLVLVGQSVIWIAFSFNREGANVTAATKAWLLPLFLVIQVAVFAWAIRTIRRGWQEHREYLALLKAPPGES